MPRRSQNLSVLPRAGDIPPRPSYSRSRTPHGARKIRSRRASVPRSRQPVVVHRFRSNSILKFILFFIFLIFFYFSPVPYFSRSAPVFVPRPPRSARRGFENDGRPRSVANRFYRIRRFLLPSDPFRPFFRRHRSPRTFLVSFVVAHFLIVTSRLLRLPYRHATTPFSACRPRSYREKRSPTYPPPFPFITFITHIVHDQQRHVDHRKPYNAAAVLRITGKHSTITINRRALPLRYAPRSGLA